jgi:hypothetical protein
MFRSKTIIRELVLSLAKVILEQAQYKLLMMVVDRNMQERCLCEF